MDPAEAADLVAKRRTLLETLADPQTKPELVERVPASRSTVDRAVESLKAASLVERVGSEFRTTFAGRQALAAYEAYLDRLAALQSAQPVLDGLSPTADIDPAVLDGAEVIESTPEAPFRPIERNVELVETATSFRGTGPAVVPRYMDVVQEVATAGDVELVLTEAVLDALTADYEESMVALFEEAGVDGYVTSEPMSYAVWTADRPAGRVSGIVVYSETGVHGVINNDTTAMNEWARATYEYYRDRAEPL